MSSVQQQTHFGRRETPRRPALQPSNTLEPNLANPPEATQDFMSRIKLNAKTNNILRIPINTDSGAPPLMSRRTDAFSNGNGAMPRQRSVFTANTNVGPKSTLNHEARPFVYHGSFTTSNVQNSRLHDLGRENAYAPRQFGAATNTQTYTSNPFKRDPDMRKFAPKGNSFLRSGYEFNSASNTNGRGVRAAPNPFATAARSSSSSINNFSGGRMNTQQQYPHLQQHVKPSVNPFRARANNLPMQQQQTHMATQQQTHMATQQQNPFRSKNLVDGEAKRYRANLLAGAAEICPEAQMPDAINSINIAKRAAFNGAQFERDDNQKADRYNHFMEPLPISTCAHIKTEAAEVEGIKLGAAEAFVMGNGCIQLRLRESLRIDMSIDGSIRLVNAISPVAVAIGIEGVDSALIHPNGRIWQIGERVELVSYDSCKNNSYIRFAKFAQKGISFSSKGRALVYLVDAAGTRTTSETFSDLSADKTLSLLYAGVRNGPAFAEDARKILAKAKVHTSPEMSDIYEINGFKIVQESDGLIVITKPNDPACLIRVSPSNGSVTLNTKNLHATASLGRNSHLFLRCGERRMHFDGLIFSVRNAGHSAGFNEANQLVVN